LAAGGDIELGEDLGQVVLDGTPAEEQLGGDLRVRHARPGQPRDLGLPGGELVARAGGAPADGFAGGQQLAAGPANASSFSQPSGVPAWKTIPSWAVIGTGDRVIPPAELTFMAKRAGAHITGVNAGHLSMISNPETVTRVIEQAAKATN
jgi:pimeloyl-ACP methyl ester carboxylesterase